MASRRSAHRPPRRPAAGQQHPRPPPGHHQPAGAAAERLTARVYYLGFADDRAFDLIASDGGLLERPHRSTRVPLSPGERAEIVAEFQPGEQVLLRSFPPDLGLDRFQGRFAGADDAFALLQLRPGYVLEALGPVPQSTRGRRAWRQAAAQIEDYRRTYQLTDPDRPLGPEPKDAAQRADRRRPRTAIERVQAKQHRTDRIRDLQPTAERTTQHRPQQRRCRPGPERAAG